MIKAILACDGLGGIAKNGILPWPRNKLDMKRFSYLTKGHTVVMGRNTWEATDMPNPLPNRKNVVVTKKKNYQAVGATIIQNNILEEIKTLANTESIMIIGGANLFASLIDDIDILYLTLIAGHFNCDTSISLNDVMSKFMLIEKNVVDSKTLFESYLRKDICSNT